MTASRTLTVMIVGYSFSSWALIVNRFFSGTVRIQTERGHVVVQEGPRSYGIAAEVIARINDGALLFLEAPVKRLTSFDVVTPYFAREKGYLPDEAVIAQGIEETLDF